MSELPVMAKKARTLLTWKKEKNIGGALVGEVRHNRFVMVHTMEPNSRQLNSLQKKLA